MSATQAFAQTATAPGTVSPAPPPPWPSQAGAPAGQIPPGGAPPPGGLLPMVPLPPGMILQSMRSVPPPGDVIHQHGMTVEFSGSGWRPGDYVQFVRMRFEDNDSGEHEAEDLGLGEVTSVDHDRARARVGIDMRVPSGAKVQATGRRFTSYPLAPPRLSNLLHLQLDARAFVPVDRPVGIGMLGALHAMYRFGPPVALRLEVNPMGFVASDSAGGTFAALGFVTLDTRYFEVGLGVGGMTVRRNTSDGIGSSGGSLSLGQFLRIGAIDGLMLQSQTNLYVNNNQFRFGNMVVMLQIPLNLSWWLTLQAGGGVAGFGFGEVGARHRVWGGGDHGTFFLTGSFGGVGIAVKEALFWYPLYVGPSVGVGLEWRI